MRVDGGMEGLSIKAPASVCSSQRIRESKCPRKSWSNLGLHNLEGPNPNGSFLHIGEPNMVSKILESKSAYTVWGLGDKMWFSCKDLGPKALIIWALGPLGRVAVKELSFSLKEMPA